MKVLFVSRRFYPEVIGGGQISGLYLAKSVLEKGHEPVVITFGEEDKTAEIDGIKIIVNKIGKLGLFPRLSNMDYMYVQMARITARHIQKIKPDIIHLLNGESIPLSAIYYKKRFNIPIVATVNGPNLGCFTQEGVDYKGESCIDCRLAKRIFCSAAKWGQVKGSLFYIYSLWQMGVLRCSYKYVDKFFCVSSAMMPMMRNMGVDQARLTVIQNPIRIQKINKTAVLMEKLGIGNNKVILYAGRLAESKGIHFLVSAMQYINDSVLLIVGEKRGYYDPLFSLAESLEIKNRVIFAGYVDNADMRKYYSIADVSVLTNTFYEPLSRFLLESCSFGIPMIASDRGGNSELVQDGKNGLLLRTYDPKEIAASIKGLLSDKEKLKDMSLECYKKASKYTLPKIGARIIDEYKMLLKRKP